MYFINEDGGVYEFDGTADEQAAEFPNDDHAPYPTEAEAEAAVVAAEDERERGGLTRQQVRDEAERFLADLMDRADRQEWEHAIGFTLICHYEGRADTVTVNGFYDDPVAAAEKAVAWTVELNRGSAGEEPFVVELRPVSPLGEHPKPEFRDRIERILSRAKAEQILGGADASD